LHRARAHLKVPGWSLVWNELLTKKLPMFLSRLNEMSGGCEKASQKQHSDRIPFSLTFHPHNHSVKSIILKNFKLLQNDPETGTIFSQPPSIHYQAC